MAEYEDLPLGDARNMHAYYYNPGMPFCINFSSDSESDEDILGLADVFSETNVLEVTYPYDAQPLSDELTIRPGDLIEVDGDWKEREGSLWSRGRKRDHACKRGSFDSVSEGYFYRAFTTRFRSETSTMSSESNPELSPCSQLPCKHTVLSYKEKTYFAVETPSEELECIICKNLADEPHQTGCCGHTVCFKCADEWRKRSNSCPNCRESPLELGKDARIKRLVKGLTVYCSHYRDGCGWKGSINDLEGHLQNQCLFEEIPCQNMGCEIKVMRRDLDDHAKNTCSMRLLACPCCKQVLTYNEVITTHYKHCPSWPKRCPNHCGTEEKLTRSILQDHIDNNCPEQVISCQFAEAGCTVRVKRREMGDHIQQSVGEHMTAMMRDHVKLKKEHGNLKKEHGTLKKGQSSLEREHNHLEKDYNALKKDYNALKKEYELSKKKLAVLEKSRVK